MPKYFKENVPKNLPLLFKEKVEFGGHYKMQAAKDKSGNFLFYTYAQVYEDVIALALAFKSIGIKKGSNVALISDNRREWLLSDLSILSLGCTDVPRGCDSMGTEIRFIISFADCEFGIFENGRQLAKVIEKIEEVKNLKKVILFDDISDDEKKAAKKAGLEVFIFAELLEKGYEIYNKDKVAGKKEIEDSMNSIEKDDIATIIFTSGTTGTPKGVMLSHRNYTAQLEIIRNFLPCGPGEWWLSILPVWHSFERIIQYVIIIGNCGIAYSKPVASVMLADMAVIKPHWMCGVPRVWEALATGVNRSMNKTGGIKLKLFKFFVSVGKKYANMKDMVLGNVIQLKRRCRFLDTLVGLIPMILLWPLFKLGNALVFKKIKAKFGGRMKMAISGGGALQKETDNFYRAIGFKLLEGYGLSETAPVISVRYYKHSRPGCVGAILPSCEVKIVEEEHGVIKSSEPLPLGKKGLILVKSEQIMKGYYKRQDLTDQIIDKDGWINTGDIGLLTLDREIKITGRAKDTIVLLGGENIEPAVIEASLLTSEYIESVIVLGQDKKYLGCLIVPAKDNLLQWANGSGYDASDYEDFLKSNEVQNLFSKEINSKVSEETGFRTCEMIYKFALLQDSFKVGEELSAKQEMMRYKIVEKYADKIEPLFD